LKEECTKCTKYIVNTVGVRSTSKFKSHYLINENVSSSILISEQEAHNEGKGIELINIDTYTCNNIVNEYDGTINEHGCFRANFVDNDTFDDSCYDLT